MIVFIKKFIAQTSCHTDTSIVRRRSSNTDQNLPDSMFDQMKYQLPQPSGF